MDEIHHSLDCLSAVARGIASAMACRMTQLRALACLVTLGLTGCCTQGEGRCAGKVVQICDTAFLDLSERLRWLNREECDEGTYCVEENGDAFCALADAPDDRCSAAPKAPPLASPHPPAKLCAADTLLHCRGSYVVYERDCPLACVTVPQGNERAFCSASPDPIPECPETGTQYICRDGELLLCCEGYDFEGPSEHACSF